MSQYEKMVKSLCKDGDTIASELTGQDAHLTHMAMGVAGEAGELLDAIKKHVVYRKPLDIENVIEELGDLEFFMAGIRMALDISRDATINYNMAKLSKRYQSATYSDQSAQTRADKE